MTEQNAVRTWSDSLRKVILALLLLLPLSLSADSAGVRFHKQYIDGPQGQIHVLTSTPLTRMALRTPMVCLAPNPASGNYFRVFMTEIGRDRLMVAPDYPGLGDSDPPDSPQDMAALAESMASVITALGYGKQGDGGKGKVDVCGYHTGAMVAVELAVSRPDLIRRVVLMGVPFYTGSERERMLNENTQPKPIKEDFMSLQGSWDFAVSHRTQGVTLERGYDNFLDALDARYYRPWLYRAVFTYPAEERAIKLQQPVLVLNTHGSLEEQTRAFSELLPDAVLIEVPELHHGIFDVGATILSDKARPFLAQ